ncbi:hypothetical protein CAPTEDRAFT_93822 [Capitella teleta]|uniref:Cupin-like domain-containing protein n=1 Tax=Capitella teleta TaxID=283909 RepID=R7TLG1_CAPTE|nr:hypothetical protein CAPTEDRAFT_93822 [Capitella teleta]|eukprot:ELT94683.1 hypothetical protein CAPTEDRAFT_93822 [Capitella teleta]
MESKKKPSTLEEKIALIDQEIRTLHEFCVNKGYTTLKVEREASPLLGAIRNAKRKEQAALAGKVAVVVVIFAVLLRLDPIYRLLLMIGRLTSIQMLAVWDWTVLYSSPCFIPNPYFQGLTLTKDDCELCENLVNIPRRENLSQIIMAEDFLKRDVPVIVTDAMEHWPARDIFTIEFINQLYQDEAGLNDILPCMFSSNVRVRYGNVKSVLSRAVLQQISNWYAHWSNCEKGAGKVLRQFYRRPYFLPPMVELAESNWLMLASRYKPKNFKQLDIALPMMYLGQFKGESKVRLTPRNPCNSTCSTLYTTLHEGEILVLTDLMWSLDYMPIATNEAIAFATGGFFDS